jgi:hypothetical protein
MGQIAPRAKAPLYRITGVERGWHVLRPHASIVHAFDDLDAAEAFVRNDSEESVTFVEIVIDNLYMVKQIGAR